MNINYKHVLGPGRLEWPLTCLLASHLPNLIPSSLYCHIQLPKSPFIFIRLLPVCSGFPEPASGFPNITLVRLKGSVIIPKILCKPYLQIRTQGYSLWAEEFIMALVLVLWSGALIRMSHPFSFQCVFIPLCSGSCSFIWLMLSHRKRHYGRVVRTWVL